MLLSLLAATALAGPILPPPDADELEKLEREEEAELERVEAQEAPRQKKEKAARGGPIKSYELAFRGRAVSVPRGILSGWFHSFDQTPNREEVTASKAERSAPLKVVTGNSGESSAATRTP